MKTKGFLLALLFALTPAIWAQDKPAQTSPGPGSRNQMRAEHRFSDRLTMIRVGGLGIDIVHELLDRFGNILPELRAPIRPGKFLPV